MEKPYIDAWKQYLNEGVGMEADINTFPDGIYTLTKVSGDVPKGTFFEKKGNSMQIRTGNYAIQQGQFVGGGTIYTNQ